MSVESSGLNWGNDAFSECYTSIQIEDDINVPLVKVINNDLLKVLLVPEKNEQHRAAVVDKSKTHKFLNGDEVKLNEAFIEIVSMVASDFNLDELMAADLIYQSKTKSYQLGCDLRQSAHTNFLERYQFILNILGYLIVNKKLDIVVNNNQFDSFFKNVLASFNKIYQIIGICNDNIDKQKITDNINNLSFINSICFIKSQLFIIHELLCQMTFSLIDNYSSHYRSPDFLNQLLQHIATSIDDQDILILHYLPSVIKLATLCLDNENNDDTVHKIYTIITEKLASDYSLVSTDDDIIDISKSKLTGYELVVYLLFFTKLIGWCKKLPSRTSKYDFKHDILKYIEWLISYGAMEKLLSYTAESSCPETKDLLEWRNLYDFRALLQRNCPRLSPNKFEYPSIQELVYMASSRPGFDNVSRLKDTSSFVISVTFNEQLLVPYFHEFFTSFVANAAIVLTLLRDNEEDFLLSSVNKKHLEFNENEEFKKLSADDEMLFRSNKLSTVEDSLNLDEIATRSDLERFYLAFTYTYSNRPELCSSFWAEDLLNDILGLISWGLSNNSSPLITATFCLLLGSLTSAGNDFAIRIWDFLVDNNSSNLRKNDFSTISIDSIVDSLTYYVDALYEYYEDNMSDQLRRKQKRQEFLFSNHSGKQDEDLAKKQIIIELSEDSVVFISGFVQLISSIVRNLNSTTERSKQIKDIIFNRFNGLMQRFLKFDNIVTSSNSSPQTKSGNMPSVQVSDENTIILVNLFLSLMGDFIEGDDDLELRYKIWRILDRWIYHALQDENDTNSNQADSMVTFRQPQSKRKFATKQTINISQGFKLNLTHFTEVSNFVILMNKLLTPLTNSSEAFAKYNLLYPADLGLGYRYNNHIGIWPYIEFLIGNVFANTTKLSNAEDRQTLQSTIMDIVQDSFQEIDWDFLSNTAPKAVKNLTSIDDIFESHLPGVELNYQLFVKLHHSVAIFNYLFDEKVYRALFSILDMGIENMSSNSKLAHLLETSLSVFDSMLKLQSTFINTLLPILRSNDLESANNTKGHIGLGTSMSLALMTPKSIFDNIYVPRGVGTNGISSFYELLLFNLSTVVYISLYVGSTNSNIADSSIKILNKVGNSSAFSSSIEHSIGGLLSRKSRLLSTFESIDESIKLQYAFIDQYENQSEDLDIKYQILNFLIDNLNQGNGKLPTTAHFLLGFKSRGGRVSLNIDKENNTLLKSLLEVLDQSLELLSEIDYNNGNAHVVESGPAKLSSLILEIIVKLSRDVISADTTLNYLRDHDNLFERLMSLQPRIDTATLWSRKKFDGDLQDNGENVFIIDNSSCQTFVSFINYRNLALQYLSLEFHHTNSKSKKEYYSSLLLNSNEFLDGSPCVLGFLDILNFNFKNFEGQKLDVYDQRYNLPLIMEQIHVTGDGGVDLSVLSKIYKVICQSSNLVTKESKVAFSEDVIFEANHFRDFVKKLSVSSNLRSVQLRCLHSWCQLLEVLITDSDVNSKQFILEVLQVILPKINDYLESDISFSEELISLSVLLFNAYEQEFLQDNNGEFVIGIQRLFPLLKTCISGVLNSNSTPNLRSDLYVLANKFLSKVFTQDALIQETVRIIKSIDKKFIEVIGNDAIYSEGSSRITSILLLESLIHLTAITKADFVLELLIQNNSLLLLVMSLRRADEMLQISSKGKSGVSMDTLLYELTAFKSTLYFLVRVAQSKAGALKLIQNELFSILKESNLLKIDPDIGLKLKIQENPDLNEIKINLMLDTPVSLNDLSHNVSQNGNISYLEFLIPIFQLISTVLMSMGPSYKPSLVQAKELMSEFNTLVVGIMKRDLLIENKAINAGAFSNISDTSTGLEELVKLFTLLDSLINYKEKQ
jgi:nuclear pore complex protein Nup205